jgi:predicted RNA-binding protein with PIN domain
VADIQRDLAAARARLDRSDPEPDPAVAVARAAANRSAVDRPDTPVETRDRSRDIAAAADAARALAEQLDALLLTGDDDDAAAAGPRRPVRRSALTLPGGVISTSAEAADFLVRSDAVLLVDGYNVAKLGWPDRSLEQQRGSLLDAVENLARRYGTDITVVFDGASIVGAHTNRRRLVRVVYSPAGVIADDVIRDEVRRLPTTRPVVVVTNDAEIVRDVRVDGANVLPSNALLAIV